MNISSFHNKYLSAGGNGLFPALHGGRQVAAALLEGGPAFPVRRLVRGERVPVPDGAEPPSALLPVETLFEISQIMNNSFFKK